MPKSKRSAADFMSGVGKGIIVSCLLIAVIVIFNDKISLWNILLRETLPFYDSGMRMEMLFDNTVKVQQTDSAEVFKPEPSAIIPEPKAYNPSVIYDAGLHETSNAVIGLNDVTFEQEISNKQVLTYDDIASLKNLEFLRSSFYTIDKSTDISADMFNVDKFISTDLKINNNGGYKVLIFHTHSQEMFTDSNPDKLNDGVFGVGERLATLLSEKYGIKTLHDKGRYDIVNGQSHILGAYERMEDSISDVLKKNPSIQVAIDLHRDGVPDNIHLVKTINGKPTAQIMFFNGLTRINQNGKLTPLAGLENPFLDTNLAFSFNMQLVANKLYPSFTRKVYLSAYRYSLNMLPQSLLIEVGAQTNTKQEALNAMEPLAEILATVLLD